MNCTKDFTPDFFVADARASIRFWYVGNAAVHMPSRYVGRGGAEMAGLVAEEEIGLEPAQERAFLQTAQEHGFVHRNALQLSKIWMAPPPPAARSTGRAPGRIGTRACR